MYFIAFYILDTDLKDTVSKTAIYNCIVYQLWYEGIFRTFFGDLITTSEAPYILDRVERWKQAQLRSKLSFYG